MFEKRTSFSLVRDGRLELPTSCSQSKRATNCANPGFWVIEFCTRCGQTCGQADFLTTSAYGEIACISGVSRDCGHSIFRLEGGATRSQITCATNCATPGYSVFLHDTTRGRKKQVSRVCGRRCGQARFFGSFSTGEFPPQSTVPRTSGSSLSGEWMSRLSSQSKRATNCATPG